MIRKTTSLAAVFTAALLLSASSAVAAPADDFRAVFDDWRPDGQITDCGFTRAQLGNAAAVSSGGDFNSYAPGFRDEVAREIARHDAGGCAGIAPRSPAARRRSALRRLRIGTIRPRGGLKESVIIRNTGSGSVSLRGATVRDRSGRRLKLGSGRLGARRSLRVFTGCAKGRRKAYRRGSRLYACQRRTVWDDRGDVVKIVDSRRVVVAQRGYGRYRRVARF